MQPDMRSALSISVTKTMLRAGGMNMFYQTAHLDMGGDPMKETIQIIGITILAVLSIIALPILYLFGF